MIFSHKYDEFQPFLEKIVWMCASVSDGDQIGISVIKNKIDFDESRLALHTVKPVPGRQ